MIYKNPDQEAKLENGTPIRIIPLGEDFKEELYNLYKVYRNETDKNDFNYNA